MRIVGGPIKLTTLEPQFIQRIDDRSWHEVDALAAADGIMFLCPKCWVENNGPIGTHAVVCWAPSVPQTTSPTPGRWNMVGTGFDDLSLVAGSSSIHLAGEGCQWHGFIRDGEVTL